jgi:hypothetical protein
MTFSNHPGAVALLRTLVICLLAGLTACVDASKNKIPAPPAPTTEEERQGDYVFQSGNPDQAVQLYDRALKSGASRASVEYRKGFAYFAKSAWVEAYSCFEQAIAADPQLLVAYEGAGISAFQLGRLDAAAARLQHTIDNAPKHWAPYVFLSAVQYARGKMAEAQKLQEQGFAIAGKERAPMVQRTLVGAFQVAEKQRATYKPGAETAAKDGNAPVTPGSMTPPVTTEELIPAVEDVAGAPGAGKANLPPGKKQGKAVVAPYTPPVAAAPATPNAPPNATQTAPGTQAASAPAPAAKVQLDFGLSDLLPRPGKEREPQATGPAQAAPSQADLKSRDAEAAAEAKAMQTPDPAPAKKSASSSGRSSAERSGSGASYIVLESSYPTAAEAERRVTALKAKGFEASTVQADIPGRGVWNRVVFGPFSNFEEAKRVRTEMAGKLSKDLLVLKQKATP